MCITFGKAHLSNTSLYGGEAEYNGKFVHTLAYQNKAENLMGKPNAMILPFPSKEGMGPENIIDTRAFPSFLNDIGKASQQFYKSLGSRGMQRKSAAAGAQVFESGSYTVVLVDNSNIASIVQAVEIVPENKRPDLSIDFLDQFIKLYPNKPIAICCWAGEIKAEPLLWWYEPRSMERIFLPAMDAHDGYAPKIDTRVEVDHLVSIAGDSYGNEVNYTESIPDQYRSLLPTRVYGIKFNDEMDNGDFFCNVADLELANTKPGAVPSIRRGVQLTEKTIKLSNPHPMHGWT